MVMEQDLGEVAGPLLVFGGPYSNLEATRAVFDAARAEGIPESRILCTGDVCAYGADPQAAADLVRRSGIAVVRGNCDENLGHGEETCGCGFGDGTACDALSQQWYAYANTHLDNSARAWMAGLPEAVTFRMAGRRFRAIHGGMDRINRFIYASAPEDDLLAQLETADCDAVIAGHCGLPFSRIVGGRLWHNAAVVGLPANDGTPRTWFSILRPGDREILIELHALEYDWRLAARKMSERGLPAGYAETLTTGLWPSLDSLPDIERAATGKAVTPHCVTWSFLDHVFAEN